ncbi:MAG: SEC-C domain-containing protein [Chloroflexi bacterium]|nr:SEC-C domain-containing protein [Chloroflexota bacterium]
MGRAGGESSRIVGRARVKTAIVVLRCTRSLCLKRTNWYSDHPTACTCADCTARAADKRQFNEAFPAAGKTGRNDPCPCGSGKKYKKCHGGS